MPIRPENKHRYPPDWKRIRTSILERAGNKCEQCGAENYKLHPITNAKVVLTIAHLNADIEDCSPDNLRAWCQKCHNSYDMPNRAAGRRHRRIQAQEQAGQQNLFAGELTHEHCSHSS